MCIVFVVEAARNFLDFVNKNALIIMRYSGSSRPYYSEVCIYFGINELLIYYVDIFALAHATELYILIWHAVWNLIKEHCHQSMLQR